MGIIYFIFRIVDIPGERDKGFSEELQALIVSMKCIFLKGKIKINAEI